MSKRASLLELGLLFSALATALALVSCGNDGGGNYSAADR